MKYAKPKIGTVGPASDASESAFRKGFDLILDNIRFITETAYEADE